MIDDFAKRHLRCSYDGARIVRHDIDCKHRDEHEQRPSEAQKDLGTTSPQEVAGSTPAVASTVGGSRMPPGEWGVGPAVKQVGRKSDHSSSDFPDTAQCVVCLTTGRGREPVCGGCLQIAGDILKTTEYGLSRDATAEEVIAALHTPDVTTFGDDRRPAEATSVGQMPRARTVSQVRETSSEDPKNADVSRGPETDAPRRNDAQEIPAPNPKCGWCKGGGFCIICQARPSSPETYADDSDRRRLEAQRAAERLAQPLGRCCISGRCDGEGCPCACHPGNPDRPDDADSRGRSEATPSELFPLAVRIEKGRQKYPNGCTLLSLLDEAGEIAHAVNKYEVEERVRDELLDVAAVAMRLYLGEIDRGLEIDGLVQRRTDTPAAGSLDAIYEPFTDEHTGETLYRCRAAATPQCCYEAPAGIHSENCPTRADEAPPPCRRCSECRGENHHWIEECEEPTPEKPDGWAGYVCRHCEARAEMCISCDGAAEPGHVCTDEEDA